LTQHNCTVFQECILTRPSFRQDRLPYNSLTLAVTNSVRFNFIYRAGSDIDVVYNDLQQAGVPHGLFTPSDRQFVVKMNDLVAG
jgi:hypothetical protein